MTRTLIGAVVGGIVQFLIGAIAWVGFGNIAFKLASVANEADLHTALARTLTATGDGAYMIPWAERAEGTALLGKGPVALIFFHAGGSTAMNPGALLMGLLCSIAMLFIVGLAVAKLATFADRLNAVLLFGVATVGYFVLTMPVYNHYLPWTYWLFLGVEEFIAYAVGAFVMLKWFGPRGAVSETLPH
jgi:hypothetical protein